MQSCVSDKQFKTSSNEKQKHFPLFYLLLIKFFFVVALLNNKI